MRGKGRRQQAATDCRGYGDAATMADMATLTSTPTACSPPTPAPAPIARELYDAVRDLPIISPHGHVPPQWLADDVPFADPTSLLITPDHYVTRLLHAHGVSLADLGVGQSEFTPEQSRNACRACCARTGRPTAAPRSSSGSSPSSLTSSASTCVPSAETADEIYDAIDGALARPRLPPAGAVRRASGSSSSPPPTTRATTCATTQAGRRPDLDGRGRCPTFRPDKYLEPASPGWNGLVDRLGEVSRHRHRQLRRLGRRDGEPPRLLPGARCGVHRPLATATPAWSPLDDAEAERLYALARAGTITAEQADTLRRNFMFEQARMASEDGLVMTMHPAVHRNHHTPTFETVRRRTSVRDIPMRGGVHQRAAPDAGRVRHRARTSRWCCSPSTRPSTPVSSRRWPASTPRCTSGRRGGSSTPPTRCAASAAR